MSEEVLDGDVQVQEEGEVRTKRERKQYGVTAAEFVKAWQSSNSAQEVADKLGMPKHIVLARSAVYRKQRKDGKPGINLKRMPRQKTNGLDVETLNRLAEETLNSEA